MWNVYRQLSAHNTHIFPVGNHTQITISGISIRYDQFKFINTTTFFFDLSLLNIGRTLVKQVIAQIVNDIFIQISSAISLTTPKWCLDGRPLKAHSTANRILL